MLVWDSVAAFGADAVTVDGPTAIGEVPEGMEPLLDKRNHVLKKRVLTTAGQELGPVKDVEFDPATGDVTALVLKKQADVAGSRLVGIGAYAVVVQADPSDRPV
ncbi:hypothetical protein GCM10025868_20720 [Angustibacter aerolatus]|uniref:PRC-barrel domain-containing protein n=1 Tax=Angustibacter aerolatus TaxID=1162965 RepID=A0ABQ6JIY1_9ACTN|nr:PRC-barrel domain-containing protein [Angustibacter aerolatus]GMA86822.1 hypothetical protein GCM10025868_20720 [Angustibacter aerolatus]